MLQKFSLKITYMYSPSYVLENTGFLSLAKKLILLIRTIPNRLLLLLLYSLLQTNFEDQL